MYTADCREHYSRVFGWMDHIVSVGPPTNTVNTTYGTVNTSKQTRNFNKLYFLLEIYLILEVKGPPGPDF